MSFFFLTVVGVTILLGLVVPIPTFGRDSVASSVSYVTIDGYIFRRDDIPEKYEAYVNSATPEEIVSINTFCGDRLDKDFRLVGRHPCTFSFFSNYPYHQLSPPEKLELERTVKSGGGYFTDWANSDSQIAGLGVKIHDANAAYSPALADPELVHVEKFLVVQMKPHRMARLLPPFSPPDSDIRAMLDSPQAFCLEGSPRLIFYSGVVGLVGCGGDSALSPLTAFFIFPTTAVNRWWEKPWEINGGEGSANPLCNIKWADLSFDIGSSEVSLPTFDPLEPDKIQGAVTLDLRTGQFRMNGDQIYPDPSLVLSSLKTSSGLNEGENGPED